MKRALRSRARAVPARGSSLDRRFFARVYELVCAVPPGHVVTYGEVARLLGVPRGARAVGWALRALGRAQARNVPWQRVVGHGGRISLRDGSGPYEQRRRLQAEGVRFRGERVDLARHAWAPSEATTGAGRGARRGSRSGASGRPAS